MNWVGEFFRAIPEALSALWQFAEGFYGLAVMLGYLIAAVFFVWLAVIFRPTRGWLSAVFGIMAVTIAFFWGFGIVPSAWVYYADGARELLEGTVVPAALPGAENFYEVFRDTVVVILTALAIMGFAVAAGAVQKRYPRVLAEGEEAGPKSGGYK